jgi:hypothetical protein
MATLSNKVRGRATASTLLQAVIACTIATVAAPSATHAEEGGSGHYLPGSFASFMDGVSPTEALIARLNVLTYEGSFSNGQPLPIAGLTAVNVEADSTAVGLTIFWRPSWGSIGERWSYAMSATIPFVDITVEADVSTILGNVRRSDSDVGLGDILLQPVKLNYAANPDLNFNFHLTFYAPTGGYEVGQLANTGKNFWTIEPTVSVMYFGQQNGIEGSLFAGLDVNRENPDTNYRSGNQFHLDGTLAQHLPLAGGLAGIGASGFYYKQVTGDSGAGATFGDFKAKTVGIGPVVSYISNDKRVLTELKWLHETETEKRLEGDTIFLKVMVKL